MRSSSRPNGVMRPDPIQAFQAQQPRLLRLAYRMLGSHAEAEDLVQEAWLRWQGLDHGQIIEPAAWLTRTVSRLCIDQMKSARARRETYPGTWLPEPLIEEEDDALRPDNLTLSLMVALERLSPLERAAFLLHDIFGQTMEEVAQIIDRAPAATRQLAARARAHVQIDRPRYMVPRDVGATLARAFFDACKSGDTAVLATMLAEGATLHADGGGKVPSVLNVIDGVAPILRMFAALSRKFGEEMELLSTTTIDGLPGFVCRIAGTPQTTALEVYDGRITRIFITRNPDKLTTLLH